MVWRLKNERNRIPKKVLNMQVLWNENGKRETKMGTTGYEGCTAEGRAWEETEEEQDDLWEGKDRREAWLSDKDRREAWLSDDLRKVEGSRTYVKSKEVEDSRWAEVPRSELNSWSRVLLVMLTVAQLVKKFTTVLRNANFHFHVHKRSPLVPILSRMCPLHTLFI
jgi:hypothetical protein